MASKSRNQRKSSGTRKRGRDSQLTDQPPAKKTVENELSGRDLTPANRTADDNPLPAWKKALFAALTVAGFFVLLEGALAVAGVEPVLYSEDPFVGFSSSIRLFVEEQGAGGETYLVTAPNKTEWFNPQRFPRDKPANTVRIFSVGGSTTYGRPYTDLASFSGWLREMLPAADPSRNWEVINAGGISYASYRVAALMEELVRYEPDLFLIYTGHNEFLERRTYGNMLDAPEALTAAGGLLSRTRIYAAGANLLKSVSSNEAAPDRQPEMLEAEVDAILDHSIGPTDYTRDEAMREKALTHFRFNLTRMIDIARSAGAQVVLVTPAANLKDCSPFKSEHREGVSEEQLRRFETLTSQAQEAQTSGRLEDALGAFEKATAIDSGYAEVHYQKGLVLYKMEHYEEAKAAFEQALAEDICPLRAIRPIQQIVREVAADRNAPLLDFAAVIQEVSEHNIPGKEYFLDHVHMNVEGYRLLALRLLDKLGEQGIANLADTWNEDAIAEISRKVESRIDDRQQGVALRNLAKVFNWAGKHEESERLAAQAAELLGEDAESYAMLGLRASERGETDEAIGYFQKALSLEPGYAEAHFNLGLQLAKQGKLDEAIDHFRQALSMKPDYGVAHGGLADALVAKGEAAEAIAHYQQAIRIHPNHAEPRHGLGIALVQQGRTDEALANFREALRIDPNYVQGHNSLGIALMEQGNREEGMEHFREALRLDPDYAQAHANLGSALASQKQFDEATRHYKEALRINPQYGDARRNLGLTYLAQGQPTEALRQFQEALRINPKDAQTHYTMANALDSMGQTRESLAHLRQAAQLQPDWPPAMTQLAWTLATHPDPAIRNGGEAVRLAERAAAITNRKDPLILEALAAAYAETGKFELAANTAEQALGLTPTGDELAGGIRRELELYRQAKPYRESIQSQ